VTFDPAGSARYVGKLAATDMLINLVGRSAVEAALMEAGMVNPSLNRPFLTTRETFILTFEQWPALANRYRAAKEAGRRALLANTADSPAGRGGHESVEHAGRGRQSGMVRLGHDICRAYASLAALARRPGLSSISEVLSLNDDVLEFDPPQWQMTGARAG
jgi:hypothetical protein